LALGGHLSYGHNHPQEDAKRQNLDNLAMRCR